VTRVSATETRVLCACRGHDCGQSEQESLFPPGKVRPVRKVYNAKKLGPYRSHIDNKLSMFVTCWCRVHFGYLEGVPSSGRSPRRGV